jgi:hypothetical protein
MWLLRATWRNIPEDTILHSHCRENLKSYNILKVCKLKLRLAMVLLMRLIFMIWD